MEGGRKASMKGELRGKTPGAFSGRSVWGKSTMEPEDVDFPENHPLLNIPRSHRALM